MSVCRLCQHPRVDSLMHLGDQPLCNRFLTHAGAPEPVFPFALGQCPACGMVQLLTPPPVDELRPRFDWISYREAEGHLDAMVEEICGLSGVSTASVIGGVSFKDDSTLERFGQRGFGTTWRINIQEDLGVASAGAGPETVQCRLTPERAEVIARARGLADVLIVRHIVEHAHQPTTFIAALRRLVRPGGYLIIEMPDCGPALKRMDYTMPWEEHVLYFTEDLLRQATACWGLSAVRYRLYPYSHENSLVAILHAAADRPDAPDGAIARMECAIGDQYARRFDGFRRAIDDVLTTFRDTHGRVALFGAGHLSCTWINFFGLQQHIDFVVDDHPQKSGLFMPGSRLPILPSSQLLDRDIKLCLLSLNQESEVAVIEKQQSFLAAGGAFASIFPGRSNSFVREVNA